MNLGQTVLTDYWNKYYASEPVTNGRCTLCGNSGILDTRGVKDALGNDVGRLNYCICPSGQEMRAVAETIDPDSVVPREMVSAPMIAVLGALNQHIRDASAKNELLELSNTALRAQASSSDRHNRITEEENLMLVCNLNVAQQRAWKSELSARKWKRYYHELLSRVSALQSALDHVELVDPKRAALRDEAEKQAVMARLDSIAKE